ncbi:MULTISPECIES: outer membrane protein transport protein [unclassified Salinivibrio]|uniref:outer membrane protein transport protein n=1 Tax=unclassified Salinivibrio TaxID=2636825 RepID=UPI0012CC67C5|nr:long-chain fatty acid transporter [Salinivibrio sp. VYel7]MPX90287.1 long-chain fatty acid transporter [Salinivibrio sp. VYel1]MPX93111.1 long-chain fatty acid transporter [Salinivibrio sp. VYel9]MPX95205.1 long-chain fatty acid transporter [Salinivibrio sp. VYel6]MPX99329.1 long-chain fatty acid transporter [Salinivibrio sp. VYel4]MPY01964.1 long-chain fatty acid transporter [Salinivibrio sp. VYel5]MPY05297.1 long-chain fatty acid transporter [Salinivibrio sp. VYel8]MPY12483.1 long-chain
MNKKQYSLIALSVFAATQAYGAGFQVSEQSASGLGRAFAGDAAVADNAAVLARNPAAMMRFDRAQLSGALTLIDPDVDVKDRTNNEYAKDVAPMKVVPAGFYVSPQEGKWTWGIGLFTTYGIATDYPDDIQAGDLAGDTDLLSTNLNPAIAYQVTPELSLGAGVNLTYAKATLTRHKGPLDPTSPSEKLLGLKGETFGYGWNLGALYEINENHRFGVGYRSKVDLDFDDGTFEDGTFDGNNGMFANAASVKGRLELSLPSYWEVSGFHQLTDAFAVHYSYQHTNWSSFTELRATSDECTDNNVCFVKDESYKDNDRWSIGSTYQFNQHWTGRLGFAYDEQAGEATLSIPDADRYWYATGLTYQYDNDLSIDAGFAIVRSRDGSFTEQNALKQNLEFDSNGTAYISSVQLNYQF